MPADRPRVEWIDHITDLAPVGPGAVELRELALRHPDREVRLMSLDTLTDGEGEEVHATFIEALDDPDSEIVRLAIEHLMDLEDPSSIRALRVVAQTHDDEEIRNLASDAIDFLE